ncbi:MCE family protein [Mycolicibacterium sp.]|uniref:MCE family protein n=1 Tax=Mycolicibacterium sp. TaxID=2320850 RepID=UPI0037C5B61B
MLKYRGTHLVRAGFIGVGLIVMVIVVGLRPEVLWSWATNVRYQAQFADAGGLVAGNDVLVSGTKVGRVTDISVDRDTARVSFAVDGDVQLGAETTAHIEVGTLLGQRVVTLDSRGAGTLRPRDVIPLSRTSSPYSLNDAVGDLTTQAAGTDTAAVNQSLDTLSGVLDSVAPQLGPTFDGLTRVSRLLSERDDDVRQLLAHSVDVTSVLSQQSQKVDSLILNANDLLGVLAERRAAIMRLLANTSVVARQLSGLVADNEKQLAPMLEKLNSVTAMLEKNRDNIAKAIPGLAKYQITQGETVANGFYYNAFIGNLIPLQIIQPFLDYAFGFRRGTDAGQPPDNAGPRSEIAFPYNGIPQPNEQWGR